MDLWVVWILVAVAFAVGEIVSLSFFLAPFAAGALAAAAVDAAGVQEAGSIAVFLVVSLLSLALVRPIAKRHLQTPPGLRTGTAALVGQSALALEEVSTDAGSVKLDGEVWTARTYVDDEVIPAGTRVHVVEIRGATALVTE